jgi:tetratricopeptide (TPR) repeat protein
LQTAYALAAENQLPDAVKVLAEHPDLRKSPEVIQFYLMLLVQGQQIKEAKAFLGSGIAPELLETPALLGLRAQVAEADDRLDEASGIFARLHQAEPKNTEYGLNHARLLAARGKTAEAKQVLALYEDDPNPEILKLFAMVYNAAGDYPTAEKYQRRYLATRPKEMPQSWGFLGDILLSRGDKLNARRAYQRGLNEMLADIARQAKP